MISLPSDIVDSAAWREMWQNPEADATVLNAMVLSKYGEESLDWDPITIQMEIKDDFGVSPAREAMDKICAMQIVMGSGAFFSRVDAFRNVVNTIANGQPFFQTFTPLSAEEIAIAISTVGMNRDMIPFAPSVRELVRLSMIGDGYSEDDFPPILSCVFDRKPSAQAVRNSISEIIKGTEDLPTASQNNIANIESMIKGRVVICLKQLDSLVGLSHIDNVLLEKGIVNALNGGSPRK